ncbi:hypothetical protein QVD99_001254 [Batrachochytrium dendrobatidis]|nr:hypothetical protein QVD99_001254 [Batrachochytrium dendrobatidis]
MSNVLSWISSLAQAATSGNSNAVSPVSPSKTSSDNGLVMAGAASSQSFSTPGPSTSATTDGSMNKSRPVATDASSSMHGYSHLYPPAHTSVSNITKTASGNSKSSLDSLEIAPTSSHDQHCPDQSDGSPIDSACTPKLAPPRSPIYGHVEGNEDLYSDWLVLDSQWCDVCSSLSDTSDEDDGTSSIMTLESVHVPPPSDTSSVHNYNKTHRRTHSHRKNTSNSSIHQQHSRPPLGTLLPGGPNSLNNSRTDLRSPSTPKLPQLPTISTSAVMARQLVSNKSVSEVGTERMTRQLNRRAKRMSTTASATATSPTVALSGSLSIGSGSLHPVLAELRENELKAAKSRRMMRREVLR